MRKLVRILHMKIIAAVNNKGGVGKSTVNRILAEYFSSILKLRTLAIDLDPQCNFSRRFIKMEIDSVDPEGVLPPKHPDYDVNDPDFKDWDGRSSIADIFYGQLIYPYPTKIANLDMAPGHSLKLKEIELVRKSELVERVYKHLKFFLNLPDVKSAYDVVIIDTAPSKGPLTICSIRAATHMLIPSPMEPQPIEGVFGMLQLWKQESLRRDAVDPIELLGILPNMFRSNVRLHSDLLQQLRNTKGVSEYMLPMKLGQRTVFAEVDAEGANPAAVFELPDSHAAKQEALAMCKYVSDKIFQKELSYV